MNLLDKILLGLGAAIALLLMIAFAWLSLANAHLRAELADARRSNDACQAANDEFRVSVLKQNKAVAALAVPKRPHRLKPETPSFDADTNWLKQRKAAGDDCRAAAQVLNDYMARKP